MLHTARKAHSGDAGHAEEDRCRAAALTPHSIAPETRPPLSWTPGDRRANCTLLSLRQLQAAHPHAPP
eukprot:14726528-Heterocapsa_arctica.AAC.1